jgi:hypothetical protein
VAVPNWVSHLTDCMQGRGFDWQDPLTGTWHLVECDVQKLKIISLGRK